MKAKRNEVRRHVLLVPSTAFPNGGGLLHCPRVPPSCRAFCFSFVSSAFSVVNFFSVPIALLWAMVRMNSVVARIGPCGQILKEGRGWKGVAWAAVRQLVSSHLEWHVPGGLQRYEKLDPGCENRCESDASRQQSTRNEPTGIGRFPVAFDFDVRQRNDWRPDV